VPFLAAGPALAIPPVIGHIEPGTFEDNRGLRQQAVHFLVAVWAGLRRWLSEALQPVETNATLQTLILIDRHSFFLISQQTGDQRSRAGWSDCAEAAFYEFSTSTLKDWT
jgi:hypothetical protein